MTRILASLSALALLTAGVQAQCLPAASGVVQVLTPTGGFAADDEGRTQPALPLGFSFPMVGSLPLSGGLATHAFLESNGELYLTSLIYGLFTPISPSVYGVNSVAELRGAANASPRICPWSGDIEAGNGASWAVYLDTSVINQATFYWQDVWSYTGGFPIGSFSFSATLYSTGNIEFRYGATGTFDPTPFNYVAVSIGNAVGTGTEVSQDLSVGADSGALGMIFEEFFTGVTDLENTSLLFTPNGLGGFTTTQSCLGAYHEEYGAGCYTYQGPPTQCFYENFPLVAAAALTGQSMVLTPTLNGYAAAWGGGTYVVPTGLATDLALTDDSEADWTPTIPFPHVGGLVATVSACSNGFVNMGPSGGNTVFSYGSTFNLVNDAIAAFRMNSDYDPASSPGGFVKAEEIFPVVYITWENVERFGATGNADRFQLQLNLVSGVVTYVWDLMQATTGGAHVVGYSPGSSLDPGSITLATALPITTTPDVTLAPLQLSAAPAPIIGGGGSSGPLVYTVSNVPDYIPPFGVGVTAIIFSVGGDIIPGGVELGGAAPLFIDIGAPGCFLHITSLDVILNPNNGGTTSPVSSLTFTIPPPLAPGQSFYAQAVSFIPGLLPNGQNAFGGLFSNGVQSYFENF